MIHADETIRSIDVVAALKHLKRTRGVPQFIRIDNGPEFISKAPDLFRVPGGVRLHFSRPGTPTDNAMIESSNRTFRNECLQTHRGRRSHRNVGDATEFAVMWPQIMDGSDIIVT